VAVAVAVAEPGTDRDRAKDCGRTETMTLRRVRAAQEYEVRPHE